MTTGNTNLISCTRTGCGKLFDPHQNLRGDACLFHPGSPVFQDGRKYYSCCPNTRASDFTQFVNLPGCTTGTHSAEKQPKQPAPAPVMPPSAPAPVPAAATAAGAPNSNANTNTNAKIETFSSPATTSTPPPASAPATPALPDQDPPNAIVAPGTACLRNGCGTPYVSDAATRSTPCIHHPGAPLFHEGSKGWTCCKSKSVLEFEHFLKIKGCTEGKHVFVKPATAEGDDVPKIRRDWYQTRDQVIVALFAKGCKKGDGLTRVMFRDDAVDAELHLPDGTIVTTGWSTFMPIDVEKSKFVVMSTKVEVVLQKKQGISWPSLEAREGDVPVTEWTTFGAVGGRFGTVGGKQVHYLGDAPIKAAAASASSS
ncbi:chord-domain-containing protein [Catenaria anguillulae PL171]|uniref:Chord-domain-containing protein n=1 Tax=Catenaria anguillulae PL171 TaxID=765915 RepID=A0A1Y2HV64_9FUNG|nr:chord-domain-containing protein [Catenaria anguillulae PL171]